MGSPIARRQNEDRSLQFLAAMNVLYARAKRVRTMRVTVTVVIAVCGLVLGWFTEAQRFLALLAWWTILDQVVGTAMEERFVQLAASIQEEFDTYVLSIPWNPRIPRLPPEEILAAALSYHGSRELLMNWYGESIPEDLGSLICMRSNMAWDYRLRRAYGWVLVSSTVAWVVVVVTVSLFVGSMVGELMVILAPSLPLVAQSVNTAKAHFGVATAKKVLDDELRRMLHSPVVNYSPESDVRIRGLQDGVYALRMANALVPDVVYSYLRRRYNDIMIDAAQQYGAEVAAAVSSDHNN